MFGAAGRPNLAVTAQLALEAALVPWCGGMLSNTSFVIPSSFSARPGLLGVVMGRG